MKKNSLLFFLLLASILIHAQDLILTSPQFEETLYSPASLSIEVVSADYNPGEPAHLNVINTEGGYRKLKLGNNPSSIYSPSVNVSAGGNTIVQIRLRAISENTDWSKIRFRPAAQGSLSLKKYVDEAGGVGTEWTTLRIPLQDFDSSIDFSNLAMIEFPYSADAPPFEIDIAKIEFIGGSTPYLWYGDNKTDNIHDGLGGPGQLIATSNEAVAADNTLTSIELYANHNLMATKSSYPFVFTIELTELGLNTLSSIARFNDNISKTSQEYQVFLEEFVPLDLDISMLSPNNNDTAILNTKVKLEAHVVGAQANEPAYLSVINQNSGYLKLKLGYDPNNIYAPGKNVIAGGNDKMIITLKNLSSFNNWGKLRLRPKSLGNLNLQSYVDAAGGITDEWTTIEIPLSDFDSSIDFTNLNYMEFPYSADAGEFHLAIKDIVFTGGDQDFRWFGENKIDNSHDGFGGAGQLLAEVIPAQTNENSIQEVAFYINDMLLYTDIYAPFACEFIPQEEGAYETYALVKTQNQQSKTSERITFLAKAPENPVSELNISFIEPGNGDSALINQTLQFVPFIEGEDLENEMYLKTWNTETGYRKLKFGYDDRYIYGQFQDVIAGGNDTLEIVLKSFSSTPRWDKIRIRPSSIGTLTLDKYRTGEASEWLTIKIPLSDFDASIDFHNLSFIEFPYSADAGAFEIGIKEVRFVGGSSPFEWFGPNHFTNAHDGTGESGAIFAQLQFPKENPVLADTVYFIVDGQIEAYSIQAPYTFDYSSPSERTSSFMFKLIDSYGYSTYSAQLPIKFYDFHYEDYSVLTLTFDQDPGDVQVSLAPLKYNKDFAYSFTLDDGKFDGYAYAYKLLNGGNIPEIGESFDGLFYTDGCGNAIPFKASLAWNSVNASFYDIHINTPDYITWSQLQEMMASGWGILNHSYSHAAYGDTDYNYQITENQNVVIEKTAYEMTQFVVPSGDLNYVDPAFELGMQAVYSNQFDYLGYGTGIDIDSPFNTVQPKIYRRYMYDDIYNPSNIMDKINEIAGNSQNGNHIWWNDFTHRIIPTPTGGSLVWETFRYYMENIASVYGADGTDQIWFAPQTDVLNYLKVRENSSLAFEKEGNTVTIYLNTSEIPENLIDYFLSINVTADAELLSVSPQFSANINFANTSTTEKLINIAWSQPTMKRMQAMAFPNAIEEEIAPSEITIFPNPIDAPKMNINYKSALDAPITFTIFSISGKEIYRENRNSIEGINTIHLTIPDLKKGIYFLSLKSEYQEFKTKKIIVY